MADRDPLDIPPDEMTPAEEPAAEAFTDAPVDGAAGEETPATEAAAELPPDDGKNWYIIHTYSGFEKKVAEDIEQKAKQNMRLLEVLDDHDDTQNVYSNFDVPAEMMEPA